MVSNITKKGGVMARVGHKFHDLIEHIQSERIVRKKSKKPVSTEKITNIMVKHKGNHLNKIAEDIINLSEEELEKKWE